MEPIFFKDMEEFRVYYCKSPRGLFCKFKDEIYFKSYFTGHTKYFGPIINDKQILFPTDSFINLKHGEPVMPKNIYYKNSSKN